MTISVARSATSSSTAPSEAPPQTSHFGQSWHAGQSLPFRTFWMWAPLHYVEENGGGYQVYVTVGDPENLPGDRNTNNNTNFLQCPPFYKPRNFTPEWSNPSGRKRGSRTASSRALTIGGKPLKKK
jgi:hypothetical protein